MRLHLHKSLKNLVLERNATPSSATFAASEVACRETVPIVDRIDGTIRAVIGQESAWSLAPDGAAKDRAECAATIKADILSGTVRVSEDPLQRVAHASATKNRKPELAVAQFVYASGNQCRG